MDDVDVPDVDRINGESPRDGGKQTVVPRTVFFMQPGQTSKGPLGVPGKLCKCWSCGVDICALLSPVLVKKFCKIFIIVYCIFVWFWPYGERMGEKSAFFKKNKKTQKKPF